MKDDEDKQDAILCELRLIRKAARSVLFVLVCGFVLMAAVLIDVRSAILLPVLAAGGIIIVIVAAFIGTVAAKTVNQMKNR